MVNKGFNLILSFGAIVGIGITIAVYKILTSPRMENTFLVIAIAVAVAICLTVAAGISYLIIGINHRRKLYQIDIAAKQIALDDLQSKQYAIDDRFDNDHARHILEVLHGHVIDTKAPKAIETANLIIPNRISNKGISGKRYDN
jgi:hypothetical protein